MIKLFKRNKIKEEKIANVFVDHFLTTIDNGFPELAALINESPEFVECPNIGQNDSDRFLLISLAANLMQVERIFPSHKDQVLSRRIVEITAELCDVEYNALFNSIKKNQSFISKVNHPSKNLIYGMSKALFYKYELAGFQEDYFKNVNAPNPILLKRLDEAVVHFMWEWDEVS
jgi:hypothetical protein